MLVSSVISLVVRGMWLGISEWIKQPWIGTSCEEVIDYAMIDGFHTTSQPYVLNASLWLILTELYRGIQRYV